MCSSHLSNAMNNLVFLNWYNGTPFLGDGNKPEFDYEIKFSSPHCKKPKLKRFSLCFDNFQRHDDFRKNRNTSVSVQCINVSC